MKHIKERLTLGIIIAVILSVTVGVKECNGQAQNNFFIEDNFVYWRKSYSSNKPFREIFIKAKMSGDFISVDSIDNKIFGELKPFEADYKGAGYSLMGTSIYILNSHISGHVIMEVRDSSISIEMKKIVFEQSTTINKPGDFLYTEKGEKTYLETYSIVKGKDKFRSTFAKDSKILNYSFDKKIALILK